MIRAGTLCLWLGMVVAGWASSALAATELEEGERLYRVHCQACHGREGKGDGPMLDQLEIQPPDLTAIAPGPEGDFPRDRIHRIIDGRLETPTHGAREMPVWGFTFQTVGGDTTREQDVEALIAALTLYLESLQELRADGVSQGPAPDD